MNHLRRELAPVTGPAWSQIDGEAGRSLKHFLAARRLVDFVGPLGWDHSAVDLGRVIGVPEFAGPVHMERRRVLPMVELQTPFAMPHTELAAADRGATDLDLRPVIDAARAAALAEDRLVFHGHEGAGITGLIPASPHEVVVIGDDYEHYPEHVATAVATLRSSDVGGPYAVALGSRTYTGVTESTEHGGYPVFEHLRHILSGPVVWAPAVDGAVVLSQRGGDTELTVGQDFSVGFTTADQAAVHLYLEETLAFRVLTPEAAVHLAHR